jgi:uncharacterized protein
LLGKTSYLGASTTFVRAAGILEKTIAADHVGSNEYYTETKVRVDWQFMLVVGIVLGAFLSSITDKSFRFEGVLFGFLLQNGRVLRFDKQIGAMLLEDMTIFKFMLSAILVGMAGILLLSNFEIITLSHKPMNAGAVLIGGALFGAGWAIMGFCPGTSLGALGEGRWHAVFAIIGMVLGAAIYAEIYPLLKSTILTWKDFGKIGLPGA